MCMQRPKRYLDHISCIRGRNLADVEGSPANAWYFQVAVQGPSEGTPRSNQWTTVYTSEQVQATRNPDWAAFAWDTSSSKEAALLREVSSIQISVYAYAQQVSEAIRPTPGHVPFRHNKGVVPPPIVIDTSAQQSPAASATSASANSLSTINADSHSLHMPHQCERKATFTAEVNLDDLIAIQGTLAALDVCLPPNTLILDLKEGFCLFPSLELQLESLQVASDSQLGTAAAPQADQSLPAQEPGQVRDPSTSGKLACSTHCSRPGTAHQKAYSHASHLPTLWQVHSLLLHRLTGACRCFSLAG